MYIRYRIPIVLLALIILPGCGSESGTGDLQGRLEAAGEISDASKRNSALAKVAADAGKAGNGEVAKKAVAKISDTGLRSSTAAEVAIALADAGSSSAAVEVASQIAGSGRRNEIMEQIAED